MVSLGDEHLMEGQPDEMMINDAELAPEFSKLRDPFDDVTPELNELAEHAKQVYGLEVSGGDIQVIE